MIGLKKERWVRTVSKKKDFPFSEEKNLKVVSELDFKNLPLSHAFFTWVAKNKDGAGRGDFLASLDGTLLEKYIVDDLSEQMVLDFVKMVFYMEQHFKPDKKISFSKKEMETKILAAQWFLRLEKCERELMESFVRIINTDSPDFSDSVKARAKDLIKEPLYSFKDEDDEDGGYKLRIHDVVIETLKREYPDEESFLNMVQKERV